MSSSGDVVTYFRIEKLDSSTPVIQHPTCTAPSSSPTNFITGDIEC
jgi:hypothetical protein